MYLEKGLPDSLLTMTYVNVPEEWTEGERRIFSLFRVTGLLFLASLAALYLSVSISVYSFYSTP